MGQTVQCHEGIGKSATLDPNVIFMLSTSNFLSVTIRFEHRAKYKITKEHQTEFT